MKYQPFQKTVICVSLLPCLIFQVHVSNINAQEQFPFLWQSHSPQDCPFEQSNDIKGILFTGMHREYTNADTWYSTWASDDNIYSPWTDGKVDSTKCMSIGDSAQTGEAIIVGDNPLKLTVMPLGTYPGSPRPYGGRYPCGSLMYNSIWYYGTYCLDDETVPGYNWGILGPFVGFRISKDFGKTWTDTPCTPARPLFGESGKNGAKVKIGAPHFIDFGKNMEHSPDGKAYLVGHGAVDPDPKPRRANLSWISGDQIYLIRVVPGVENMNDPAKYEFFAGNSADGNPLWTNNFSEIKPLIDWNNRCGCVTMTYNPGLKKYLMCITDGWPTVSTMNTYILESDKIAGPWKIVVFMEKFGAQGYFVNFPSKFISKEGRTAWLCYSANFTNGYLGTKWQSNPSGSRYGMCLQEVKLLGEK